MDAEDVAGRIKGLVIRLGVRLSARDQALVVEMVDHNEPLVALEWLSEALAGARIAITPDERADLNAVAQHYESDLARAAIARRPAVT